MRERDQGGPLSPAASVVLATYDQPKFLEWVLITVARQSVGDFEVVVADDGSGAETRRLLERFAPRFPGGLRHVWQEDRGFRKCLALNRAVHATTSPYLIFVDGDCLLHRHFVRAHLELARPGRFLIGRMPRLGPKITGSIRVDDLESGKAQRLTPGKLWDGLFGQSTKIEFGVYVPVRWAFELVRRTKKRLDLWGGNFSCSKADFVAVNGFNNEMTGWGREDEELGVRLQNLGLQPFSVANRAVNYHLWHGRANRIPADYERNTAIKQGYVERGTVRCPNGYDEANRCEPAAREVGGADGETPTAALQERA